MPANSRNASTLRRGRGKTPARRKYDNPPLSELVFGSYFEQPLHALRAELVGLFWAQIRDKFPTIRQQPEISLPITAGLQLQLGFTDEQYPMARYWLISEDDTTLIQIQKNAFLFNWRKRNGDYPGYENIKAKFHEYLDKFKSFLVREIGEVSISPKIAELTYINQIDPGDYWTGANDIQNVIPELSIPDLPPSSGHLTDFNYISSFRRGDGFTLNVSARTGRRPELPQASILTLEIRSLGTMESASQENLSAWFDEAHTVVGEAFNRLTSPAIQNKHWKAK